MNGILNINKPEGPTSFNIVSRVKKLTGEKRVGHAGTLDPAASGVLPVCLGSGTRVIEYLMEGAKDYRAEIEFGKTTDTYDAAGSITSLTDSSSVNRNQIETALNNFLGKIQQVPPIYSALKRKGKPYYELARAGIDVEIASRPVMIHNITVRDWKPPVVTIDVTCGKGTYIRSIAHDLGQIIGCGAHMKSLERRKYGPFSIDDAVSIDELERSCSGNFWQRYIHPIDSVLLHLKSIVVNDDIMQDIQHGRTFENNNISIQTFTDQSQPEEFQETRCRAYGLDGCFLGILRYVSETGQWKPEKVFI
ncbi:MAG: tRNA pseudouridine(55) synthase TruB [Chloroflexi bacterium RBG_13_46_14]|nr:MAG: tRNA pseudouridine(55) synthase TruB [Chloroflexi bacterium RBG_13_46_14]